MPEIVDKSNWNHPSRNAVLGGACGGARVQTMRNTPETFAITMVEDDDTGKMLVTATRTDGGLGSPGWQFSLSFNGETSGDSLALIDQSGDDGEEQVMLASDWKEQYIELHYFKNPGRCSLCRTKTTNKAIPELRARLCNACTVSGVMAKTTGLREFSLVAKDVKDLPFAKIKGANMVLNRHVKRKALKKHGGKEKFIAKQISRKMKAAKAALLKLVRDAQARFVNDAVRSFLDADISIDTLIANKIDAASEIESFKKKGQSDKAPWCAGLSKLLVACKLGAVTLLRQDKVRMLLNSPQSPVEKALHAQACNTEYRLRAFASYNRGDGSTTGWLAETGIVRAYQCVLLPRVQQYLVDGADVVNPDSAGGDLFTEATFFAWWSAKILNRAAKLKELHDMMAAKAEEWEGIETKFTFQSEVDGNSYDRANAPGSKTYKDLFKLTDLPDDFGETFNAILKDCDAWIKATEAKVRQKADDAATVQTLTGTILAKFAAESPELVPSAKELKLLKAGMGWHELITVRASPYGGNGCTFKAAPLSTFYAMKLTTKLKQSISSAAKKARADDSRAPRNAPTTFNPTALDAQLLAPEGEIATIVAAYKDTVGASELYTADWVAKGWQRRIPLLMEDAAVRDAILGGDGIPMVDPFYIFASARAQYADASLNPEMVQAAVPDHCRREESDTLPWKCKAALSVPEGKSHNAATCLCGDDGPARFKAAVLEWSARRDALFEWLGANKTTLSNLAKDGDAARKELFQFLASPFINCSPDVMQNVGGFKLMMPLPEEARGCTAQERVEKLIIAIEEHQKTFRLGVEGVKQVLAQFIAVPVAGAGDGAGVGAGAGAGADTVGNEPQSVAVTGDAAALVDRVVTHYNDAAAKIADDAAVQLTMGPSMRMVVGPGGTQINPGMRDDFAWNGYQVTESHIEKYVNQFLVFHRESAREH